MFLFSEFSSDLEVEQVEAKETLVSEVLETTMEIEDTEYTEILKVEPKVYATPKGTVYTAGIYVVGKDIAPGTYTVSYKDYPTGSIASYKRASRDYLKDGIASVDPASKTFIVKSSDYQVVIEENYILTALTTDEVVDFTYSYYTYDTDESRWVWKAIDMRYNVGSKTLKKIGGEGEVGECVKANKSSIVSFLKKAGRTTSVSL